VAKDKKNKVDSGPNDPRTIIRDTIREHEDRKPNKTTDDILRALDSAGYTVERKSKAK
jgi:hypothetical protein